MPEIEEIDDEEAQRLEREEEERKRKEQEEYDRAVKDGDRRRAVDQENQKQKALRQQRIEEQKKKTAELINKIGKVDMKDEENPDFLFKMPEPNAKINVKETGYEIFMSEDKGRGIKATRDFKPGNLVIQAEPYAYVIFEAVAEHCCHHCFNMVVRGKDGKPNTQLLRCSACKFARYCSRECQKKAWPRHKKECMAIKVTRTWLKIEFLELANHNASLSMTLHILVL